MVPKTGYRKRCCGVCGKTYVGYGNNARPLKDCICCDDCNVNVLMLRIRKAKIESKKD